MKALDYEAVILNRCVFFPSSILCDERLCDSFCELLQECDSNRYQFMIAIVWATTCSLSNQLESLINLAPSYPGPNPIGN